MLFYICRFTMNKDNESKIFTKDIQEAFKTGNYVNAFKIVEKDNAEYKKNVLNSIKKVKYVCS